MTVIEAIKKLEQSDEYTSWKKEHPDAYLVHAFKMLDKANKDIWQIGYFNKGTNLISVFLVGAAITKNEDAEVFKEQEKLVHALDIKQIKIFEDDAIKRAEDVLGKEYKGTTIFKTFMILQNLENIGQIWNVTFITEQFKTVNVKIDAQKGDCIGHKLVSLISEHH
jgi:hypothetical protein